MADFPAKFEGRRRVVIEHVRPEIDAGAFAIKRVVGDRVRVTADVFGDGHDHVRAKLLYRRSDEKSWSEVEMVALGNDAWEAEFRVDNIGEYVYTVEGWVDHFDTWRSDMQKRLKAAQDALPPAPADPGPDAIETPATISAVHAPNHRAAADAAQQMAAEAPSAGGQLEAGARPETNPDIDLAMLVGAQLAEEAALQTVLAKGDAKSDARSDKKRLEEWAAKLRDKHSLNTAAATALDKEMEALVLLYPDRSLATRYARELPVTVDRKKAEFSAWYELFPRSYAAEPGKHGTFKDVERELDYVAELGFDVLYFPPIHPIGKAFRKGKNNSVTAAPGDVGSPWAIGGTEGGHTAIHPDLGTLEDFQSLRRAAESRGIELALDIAFQASPDHPWASEHQAFFKKRPDGTIQYAENPPKKYQDIYPIYFETEEWRTLWNELEGVMRYWAEQGVRIFRVDNPHTKAFPFWQWAIASLKRDFPDLLFLAEAFTRPKVMYRLAKLGFSQSYTYFTWRNTKADMTEYLTELTQTEASEFFRPNFWPNTPDILHEQLQTGSRAMFISRLVQAAMLSGNYGIYGAAFELLEHVPVRPGAEEYLNSEKYEIKRWNRDDPNSLRDVIARVNRIRNGNAALQSMRGLVFHPTDNPQLMAWSKTTDDGSNAVLVVVNLDHQRVQSGFVTLDLTALGLTHAPSFGVRDLLNPAEPRYQWFGARNYVELRPWELPAHVFTIEP